MKRYTFVVSVLVAVLAVSCAKKNVGASVVSEKKPSEITSVTTIASNTDLTHGKALYENNCGKCHKLFSPSKHTKEEWVNVVNRMAPKARISEEEKTKVYNYIISAI